MRRLVLALLIAACQPASASCFETLARTRNFTLGEPRAAAPERDGKHALYLRSGPEDTALSLFELDFSSGAERRLAGPDPEPKALSVEERARRERMRMTLSGITDYAVSDDGGRVLVSEGDALSVLSLPGGDAAAGEAARLPGRGWIAPRLSPDGRAVAAVRDDDLHVIDVDGGRDVQLTQGGSEALTHGLAEFAAAEEFDRDDGAWWSPDGARLLYEEADSTAVEKHFIADVGHPEQPPAMFRYPRAGTANARVRLGVIARAGGPTTWLDWDHEAFPYVARVVWPKHGKLSVVVLDRAQQHERLLAADPETGRTTVLLEEADPAWLDIAPDLGRGGSGAALPRWLADGSGFLWAAERGAQWRLELRHADGSLDHAVTPAGWRFDGLADVDEAAGSVVVVGGPDRLGSGVFRAKFSGGEPQPLSAEPGLHDARFAAEAHGVFVDRGSLADGGAATVARRADGTLLAALPSVAETPARLPQPQYLSAGPRGLDAMVLRPADFVAGRRYPVVLSVYAGPGVKMVRRAPRFSLQDQCLADQGFIVAALDGRGTPGRDHDFERATRGNLIDLPLADQIEGLQALAAAAAPEMDMSRVGVTGWSFGGYFSAMAAIRRPDVFAAGVAGAPVVDFSDYDTAYTERYLGLPQEAPEAYRASDVLTYAADLSRPLLILHGMTDDNVYFENTFKLTQALFAAGRPYRLILLPGTHLLPDPLLRARVGEAAAGFLAEQLRAGR